MARLDWDRARSQRLVSDRGSDFASQDPTYEAGSTHGRDPAEARAEAKAWQVIVKRQRQRDLIALRRRLEGLTSDKRLRNHLRQEVYRLAPNGEAGERIWNQQFAPLLTPAGGRSHVRTTQVKTSGTRPAKKPSAVNGPQTTLLSLIQAYPGRFNDTTAAQVLSGTLPPRAVAGVIISRWSAIPGPRLRQEVRTAVAGRKAAAG